MKYCTILTLLLAVAGVVGTTSGAHATAASTRGDDIDEVSPTSNTNLRSTNLGAAKEDSIDQTERELPEVNRIINNNKKGKNLPFLEDKKIYGSNPWSAFVIGGTDVTYSTRFTGFGTSNMETGKTYEWQAGKGYLIALLVQAISGQSDTSVSVFYLLFAGAMVFSMQTGFAMLCGGSLRQTENFKNTVLKSILDACGGALGFWSVGYAFAYGGSNTPFLSGLFGTSDFFSGGLFPWFFQSALAAFVVPVASLAYPVAVYSVEATSDEEGELKLDIVMNIGQPDEADEDEDVPDEVVEYIQEKLNAIFTETIRILRLFYQEASFVGVVLLPIV